MRTCPQHNQRCLVASETHDSSTEAIRARIRISLEEFLLYQYLQVPVDRALRQPRRGDQLWQRNAGINSGTDLTQNQASSPDCASPGNRWGISAWQAAIAWFTQRMASHISGTPHSVCGLYRISSTEGSCRRRAGGTRSPSLAESLHCRVGVKRRHQGHACLQRAVRHRPDGGGTGADHRLSSIMTFDAIGHQCTRVLQN